MTVRLCRAQYHEDGRYQFCGRPATRYTNGDAHTDAFCEDDARAAIEAGAWDRGPISTGLLTWGPPYGVDEAQTAALPDVLFGLRQDRRGRTWALVHTSDLHRMFGVVLPDRDAARAWCERKAAGVSS